MLKTKDGKLLNVEELTWENARVLLKPLVPELVEIIDAISPDTSYKLYRASYPFGAKILDKNESYLPLQDGKLVSFNSHLLPESLIENLGYDPTISNPVAIVLNKNSEFYITNGDRNIPYAVITPGDIFGSARILDNLDYGIGTYPYLSFFIWKLTSGCRSVFMLPKISDNIAHNKLIKNYGLSVEKPKQLSEHWLIFRDIAKSISSNWHSEFLYFSNSWFKSLKEPRWARLYCYLLRENRQSYRFWHNIFSWQITIEQSKSLRYTAYTLETAKHIFAIAASALPGFKPAIDNNSAPISEIQEAYINGYNLADYPPIIMEPGHFSINKEDPVYYSLNFPTLIQYNEQLLKGKSMITLLDELSLVIEKYRNALLSNSISKITPLHQIAKSLDFAYFHEDSIYNIIKDVYLIPQEDERFLIPNNSKAFPGHSPFLKGCIKISRNF